MQELESAREILLKNFSIKQKMRALFTLRNILTDESAAVICEAFSSDSVLLKHELAYVLGQMQINSSLPKLRQVLADETEDEIVRHEAAEALGNFNFKKEINLTLLEQYLTHQSIPLKETCYLAIKKIKNNQFFKSEFDSFDPVNDFEGEFEFEDLKKVFLNPKTDLFVKYQILFKLRNRACEKSINLLCEGMTDQSELFKHEIAFVIGQIANYKPMYVNCAIKTLINELTNQNNHPMVRHECAEALGSICSEEAELALKKFVSDDSQIVKESCEVALDLTEYKNSEDLNYSIN